MQKKSKRKVRHFEDPNIIMEFFGRCKKEPNDTIDDPISKKQVNFNRVSVLRLDMWAIQPLKTKYLSKVSRRTCVPHLFSLDDPPKK